MESLRANFELQTNLMSADAQTALVATVASLMLVSATEDRTNFRLEQAYLQSEGSDRTVTDFA